MNGYMININNVLEDDFCSRGKTEKGRLEVWVGTHFYRKWLERTHQTSDI